MLRVFILRQAQDDKELRWLLLYCRMKRWDRLSAYQYDGLLEIDNNLVENAIRPIALGRKNYLFAGTYDAARGAASIYSFFAICKKHEVNPAQWIQHVFEHIMDTKVTELHKLYPQNFKENKKE